MLLVGAREREDTAPKVGTASRDVDEAVGMIATSSACPVGRFLRSELGVSVLSDDQ